MFSHLLKSALVFQVALLAVAQTPAQNSADQSNDEQIIILRNGQTMQGRVTWKDGLYILDLGDGQIRLKPADVDLVCKSIEDGYQRKRSLIQVGNVANHLELTQWCLRHGLLGRAAAELADATAAEPNHPMIPVLRNRLNMALEPPPVADNRPKPLAGPSNEELDRMVRGMPRSTIETFTQSVQPVLLNHCAAAGCHGPQSETALRLFRVPSGKSASRRITQRNLYSVLPLIDRDNPDSSRLLSAASNPHGTTKHAIFNGQHASQYQRLVEWAHLLSQQAPVEMPASVTPAAQLGPIAADNQPHPLPRDAHKAAPLNSNAKNTLSQDQKLNPKTAAQTSNASNISKTSKASFEQPADPFDPEAFNRQYSAKKAEAQKESASNTASTAK